MAQLDDHKEWMKSLPNRLTLARMAVIPLLLLLYPLNITKLNYFCAVLFAFAAITDFLDGYLARRFHLVTPLGALLDPIADKMLVAAALILLTHSNVIPSFLAVILVCRDIGVSGIRLMALEEGKTIEVSDFGKWKTAVSSLAIFCLMVNEPVFDLPFRAVGMLTLWLSVGLSLYSAWAYARAFLEKTKMELHL